MSRPKSATKYLVPRNLTELYKRLREAEELLNRGVTACERQGWEPGESADEWKMAARSWVKCEELEREIFGDPVFEPAAARPAKGGE